MRKIVALEEEGLAARLGKRVREAIAEVEVGGVFAFAILPVCFAGYRSLRATGQQVRRRLDLGGIHVHRCPVCPQT